MTDYPGWAWIPAAELGQHKGRIVSVYRSRIPTRIVDLSRPDGDGAYQLTIEWTEATAEAGGLISHDAGRREVVEAESGEEYLVRVEEKP